MTECGISFRKIHSEILICLAITFLHNYGILDIISQFSSKTKQYSTAYCTNTFITPYRWKLKTLILSTNNRDKKWLETEFVIAICRQSGDKWQSTTLFLTIFDCIRWLLRAFSIAAYQVWTTKVILDLYLAETFYMFPYFISPSKRYCFRIYKKVWIQLLKRKKKILVLFSSQNDQGLHCLLTKYLIKILIRMNLNTTKQP